MVFNFGFITKPIIYLYIFNKLKKNNPIKNNHFKKFSLTSSFDEGSTTSFRQKLLNIFLITVLQLTLLASALSNFNSALIDSQSKKIVLEKLFGLIFNYPFSTKVSLTGMDDLSSIFSELAITLNVLL